MKKMLCYMLSSVFLLAILNSCGDDDEPPPPPTLADLAGNYTGDSDLDLNVQLTPAVAVTSDKATDGATIEFKDADTDNLVITVTDAQLKVAGGTAVPVNGVFTFSIDNLSRANATDDIAFDIGTRGSVDITVGVATSASGITFSLTNSSLTNVNATAATASGITLTADVTIPQAAGVTALIQSFNPSAPVARSTAEVEITLVVESITENTTP